MRFTFFPLFALFAVLGSAASALAQDAGAIQFAEDAIIALGSDYDSTRQLVEKGVAHAADLRNCKLRLLDAHILLYRLKKDNDAVTAKLQDALEVHEQQLAESRVLTERGAGTDEELSAATIHVLKAKLRLAKHVHDDAAVDAIVHAAIKLEQQRLERITHLVKQGVASPKDIALQKMRLAVLMGDKTIEAD